MPAIFFVQYLFMAIGVKIGDKFGARVSTIISVVIMLTSYSIILTQKNYYAVLGGMAIFGMGDGIGNLSVINNGFRYFPNKRGLVNGVILGGMGLASSVLTPLADYVIINPNKEDVESNGFYPAKVANNLVNFIKTLIGIFVVLGALAISLTFPYVQEEVQLTKIIDEQPNTKDVQIRFGNTNTQNSDQLQSNDNTNVDTNTNSDKQNTVQVPHDDQPMMEAFCSMKNLQLSVFCFSGPFFCFLITNTNRAFGNINQISQSVLQLMAFLYGVINGLTRFMWGFLLDKFSFKMLMGFILLTELIVSASIYHSASVVAMYLIENFCIATCLSGTFVMITPTFHKTFGPKNGTSVYGLTGMLVGLASLLGPITTKLLITENTDYLKVYLIGSVAVALNLIVLTIFVEKPYIYKSKRQQNQNDLTIVSSFLISKEASQDISKIQNDISNDEVKLTAQQKLD